MDTHARWKWKQLLVVVSLPHSIALGLEKPLLTSGAPPYGGLYSCGVYVGYQGTEQTVLDKKVS